MSQGQRKKILLARSLCEPAHVFVWDEPLNYIDVYARMQIMNCQKIFCHYIRLSIYTILFYLDMIHCISNSGFCQQAMKNTSSKKPHRSPYAANHGYSAVALIYVFYMHLRNISKRIYCIYRCSWNIFSTISWKIPRYM